MSEKITFLAAFPPIQTAIKTSGNGDGMRIQLDIPEDQMEHALWLLNMRQQILRVTVEVVDSGNQTHEGAKNAQKTAKY